MDTENKLVYYVDYAKASKKGKELEITINPKKPVIKNDGMFADAGVDLFAAHAFVVPPHSMIIVDTFIGVVMPSGVAGLLWPRGGDEFLLGSGVIDTGYTGTIKVKIINPYIHRLLFEEGDSVGQLVLFKKGIHSTPELQEVEKIDTDQYRLYGFTRGSDGRINDAV